MIHLHFWLICLLSCLQYLCILIFILLFLYVSNMKCSLITLPPTVFHVIVELSIFNCFLTWKIISEYCYLFIFILNNSINKLFIHKIFFVNSVVLINSASAIEKATTFFLFIWFPINWFISNTYNISCPVCLSPKSASKTRINITRTIILKWHSLVLWFISQIWQYFLSFWSLFLCFLFNILLTKSISLLSSNSLFLLIMLLLFFDFFISTNVIKQFIFFYNIVIPIFGNISFSGYKY